MEMTVLGSGIALESSLAASATPLKAALILFEKTVPLAGLLGVAPVIVRTRPNSGPIDDARSPPVVSNRNSKGSGDSPGSRDCTAKR